MNGLLPLASAAVMLTGMFAVMLGYDLELSLVALFVCPPLYFAITRISGRIHQQATDSRAAESALYARAEIDDRRRQARAGLRARGRRGRRVPLRKRAEPRPQPEALQHGDGLRARRRLRPRRGDGGPRLARRPPRDGRPAQHRRADDLPLVPQGPLRPDPEHQPEPRGDLLLPRRARAGLQGARHRARREGRPPRAAPPRRHGPRPLRERPLRLRRREAGSRRPQPRDPAGRARGAPGRHGGRQEHARGPSRPLLRPPGGARHDRRARPARRDRSARFASRSR